MEWEPSMIHQYVLQGSASLLVHDREAQDGTAEPPANCGTNHSAILGIPVRPDHGVHLL
jgi:hypothetical protein